MRIKGLFLLFLLGCYMLGFAAIPAPDNNCLSFDGENDYVVLANESAYDVTSRFTVEFWIKVNEWDRAWQAIITKGDDTWRVQRDFETNYIRLDVGDKFVSSTTEFNDGEWHHVVCEKYDNQLRIYVDGVVEDIEWYAPLCPTNNQPVIIGENSGASGRFFNGQIDDIRIWNRARYHNTSSLPPDLWNHPPDLSNGDLISYFSMDDDSDPNLLVDDKGTGNGTIYGAQYVSSPTPVGLNLYAGEYFDPLVFEYDLVKIYGDVGIRDSLFIEPGVTVEFLGHYSITVHNQAYFTAEGTESEPITFTVADTTNFSVMNDETDTAGSWKNIKFYNALELGTINHCIFEYSKQTAVVINYNANLQISNSLFRNNYSLGKAGAIYVYDNGYNDLITTIDNCVFENNRAYGFNSDDANGGAIYLSATDVLIKNCLFDGNQSVNTGGAIALDSSLSGNVTSFYNNILINNSSENGGALWIKDYDHNTFNNNIFKDNSATNGGGIYFDGTANLALYNNIIMGNTANSGNQIYINSFDSNPSFEYSIIEGGFADFAGAGVSSYSGTYDHCYDRDPLFVGSGDHPYDISDVSPCINGGKPGTTAGDYDFLGNDRIFTATASNNGDIDTILNSIDIGPYEKQQDSGIISNDFTVSSYLNLHHDLTIPDGTTFTINASVNMEPDVCINIYGSLIALGTFDYPRTIDRLNIDNTTDEAVLNFFGPSTEDNFSQLDFCRITQPGTTSNVQYGGAIYVEGYDDLLIRNSQFKYGRAEHGGALAFVNSSAEMNSCVLISNQSTTSGGAIHCSNASPILANLTIYDNTSDGTYGAIAADAQSDPEISSCIIWNNGDSPVSTNLNVKFSDVEGGYDGVQNIDADPNFVRTQVNNVDLRLKSISPCLNAGMVDTSSLNMPNLDFYGNPRIHQHTNSYYTRVDMGGYEYPGLSSPYNLEASDGNNNYPGYVNLSWEFNDGYNPLNGFQIYRNNNLVGTVYPQIYSYSDYEATPGVMYEYSVVAYAGTEISEPSTDSGYLKPNGIITGTITTPNNNPVADITVSLEPSSGYCLEFDEGIFGSEVGNIDFYDTTLEFWIKTQQTDTDLFDFISVTLPDSVETIEASLQIDAAGNLIYTDDAISIQQDVDSLVVNDNQWHHIAVVTDLAQSNTKMYIDGVQVADDNSAIDISGSLIFICGNVDFFSGVLDDIRLWNTVRTEEQINAAKNLVIPWNSEGLVGYWGMNEGSGDICFDATNYGNNGNMYGTSWSADEPGIVLGGITNNWGEYSITQIPFGSYTTFTVTPSKPGHFFQPEQRLITLSSSNISANDVDFTDDSLLPISGRVMFQNTMEPVQEAYILLNGANSIPPTITDDEGYYVMEVEHGTECLLSVDYHGHEFNRVWDLGAVTFPQANKHFENVTRTCCLVEVLGGEEGFPIGAFDILLQSMSGNFADTLLAGSFSGQWTAGRVIVDNIPPLNYNVTVTPNSAVYPGDPFDLLLDQQFTDLRTQSSDLRYPDLDNPNAIKDTLTYVWYNDLQVAVEWPDDYDLKYFLSLPNNSFFVVPQNEWITLEVSAFEDYEYDDNGHITYLNDCDITINDEIGPTGETETAFVDTTIFVYEFAPYLPNLLSGGNRPYQNKIEIEVYDADQDRYAIQTDWAITEGAKPQESTFSTTSPEIPFLVLHDPPGDQSFASFNQSSSHSTAFSVQVDRAQGSTHDATLSLGLDIVQNVGLLYSVQTEIDVICDMTYSSSMNMHQSKETEQLFTFTTTEEYTTSADDQLIGLESDLFVGGAINLLWGLTKELAWNDTIQDVEIEDNIMVTPDGFETMYIYTESQIRQNVIPNCYAIQDTASAVMWQNYLDMNLDNIDDAVANPNHPGNISFNAGAGYTYEETTSSTSSKSFTFETTVSNEFGMLVGALLNGVGGSYGYTFETSITYGMSSTQTYETQNTMTYVLADDDEVSDLNFLPDYFTVDIKKDPVYGTPVFDLISGVSSNRWEPETTPRAGVTFGASTNSIQELAEGDVAVFLLHLGNDSRTHEDRRYYLTMHHGTNPGGALVKINGFPLIDAIPIDIPGDQMVDVVMTLEQGPSAYVYDDLTLEFYDLGDRGHDSPDSLISDHDFYLFQEFDVSWEPPYSRVDIFSPNEDWILNAANDDTLDIVLYEYDLSKPTFESIKFQYKHPYDDTWFTADQIYRAELEQLSTNYFTVEWAVDQISDGAYLIRAGTTDSIQADYYCQPVAGHIDRAIPEVLGNPQPGDGILSLGDEIYVNFTEFIDPTFIDPFTTSLIINSTGDPIDIDIDCFENNVTLTSQWANYYIENETLTATVAGIKDLYGNVLSTPVVWEFYVNSNPVFWETSKIELIKPLGESMQITTHLINSGGQFSSWSINSLPDWLTADIYTGTLLPLDTQTINFTISNELSFGTFIDTVYADIPALGIEPLVFEVSVLANPPDWAATQLNVYDYSMTITGELFMEGETSDDTNDIIGAFVEDDQGGLECRGYASLQLCQYTTPASHQFYLTVHSNEETADDLIFRVWDASTSKEHYGITEQYSFVSGGIYGTILAPETIHVSDDLIRTIDCHDGWNWLSVNLVNSTAMGLNTVLASLSPQDNDFIKNQTSYAQYTTDLGWVGSLSEIATTEMVKLNLANDDELLITGPLEDLTSTAISYGSGWNWIGYLPHYSFTVNQALADLDNAATGDLIKNQNGYAQYVEGFGWYGSLLFMNAGDGFMLHTANTGTFTYPENSAVADNPEVYIANDHKNLLIDDLTWTVDPLAFEFSSNITAVVSISDTILNSENAVLGAFCNDECRGLAYPLSVQGQWTFFLTQYANVQNETFNYKVYLIEDDLEVDLAESLQFVNNQILGDPLDPFVFHVPSGTLPAPANVMITITSSQIELRWDEVIGADGYKVYSSADPQAAFPAEWALEAEHIAIEFYADTDITNDKKFYRITAVSSGRKVNNSADEGH
ncbi:MAG: Ig-like domain-containing protein [Candidatus Cloacimonetes bacterium]|nr:Ig-like domain-containing protein [Candidatus Cloacimonadota bacterium]MCF7869157.1 Ig-like domain-containing protein [Candidatus Cloacimonadota bacterium]MCF7884607.1 Ig-like domain-containing protein [Candidatus Cloacimonadota bacterium]